MYTTYSDSGGSYGTRTRTTWETVGGLSPTYYNAPTIASGSSGVRSSSVVGVGNSNNGGNGGINLGGANVTAGLTAAQGGLTSAQSGVGAVVAARPDIQNSINLMGQNINDIIGAGGNIGRAADAMNQDIANVRTTAQNLRPYADELQRYAGEMWNEGINLGGQGQDLMAQGNSLLNLNANAGGLVGEIVKSLGMIDPNAYVSMGAADVQSGYNNAQEQLTRNLTRAGADASSLKTAAMQTQLAQGLAGALAGAKTRLRVQGVKDRFAALGTALQSAESIVKQGVDTMQTALGYQTQASQNQTNAGNLIAKMGELQAEAGNLQAQQGRLYGDQASAYASAGNLADRIGGLSLDYANSLVRAYGNETSAYNAITEAQLAAAKFYQGEESLQIEREKQSNEIALANQRAQLQTNEINAGLQKTYMSNYKNLKGRDVVVDRSTTKYGIPPPYMFGT